MKSDSLQSRLLDNIDLPEDIRKLSVSQLPQLCDDVRNHLIDVITSVGGHFGAGLGVVELTVALHYVFNTPKDKIVWDVGHQAYPHKIVTGRKNELHTIRQRHGLSPFLKRTESEYDVFGAGHASTSISAGLGIATARDFKGEDFEVVSIIGDGSMTGGMAYEAMNNCGVQGRKMIVILNDNNFSIAPNVWAIGEHFTRLATTGPVQKFRNNVWDLTGKLDDLGDRIRKVLHRVEGGVKAVLTPGMLFESLGFKYFGPINGHNINQLVKTLSFIRDELNGPVLLHLSTQKGKGYDPAERDDRALHAIGKIDKTTGQGFPSTKPVVKKAPKYQDVFGDMMTEICDERSDVVAITAAMPDGTGLNRTMVKHPERVIDVGIAEEHAVTLAAGIATEGVTPVVAIYSTFLQRAFDQIVHDCAIQKLHVVFCMDRAGVAGADGPTHHGVLDIAYLRIIQGMVVMAPKDEQELRNMMHTAINVYREGPIAIRYPRGNGEGVELTKPETVEIGVSETVKSGTDLAMLAFGNRVYPALRAAEALESEGISVEVVNARFTKPLDTNMIDDIASRFSTVLTIEDGQREGGFGSAVMEYLQASGQQHVKVTNLGYDDIFVPHGTQEELWQEHGLDEAGIAASMRSAVGSVEVESK